MMRRFASLEVLDQEAVTKIAFDAPAAPVASSSKSRPSGQLQTTYPFDMAGSFITGVDGSIISTFLTRYVALLLCQIPPVSFEHTRFFPLFDSQSAELADVYDPNATFSYSAYTQIPPRGRLQRWHQILPNQKELKWDKWIRNSVGGSRNLKVIMPGGSMNRELRSLHAGPEAIAKAISVLPKTRHDVAGAAEKFCIDAWPVGQGAATMLFLCVHGEFAECMFLLCRSMELLTDINHSTRGRSSLLRPHFRSCPRSTWVARCSRELASCHPLRPAYYPRLFKPRRVEARSDEAPG